MSLTPGTKLGPYEVLAPLGTGGMGEVYRAKDTRLDRTVALKVLPHHLAADPGLRQRFEREARAVSSLNHPHICALFDVGQQDGTDYLVMEYLEGESLADRLAKGPLPIDQVLRYGIEIANALDKAHRQGIVHRDLKPGNVMLTKSGVKLLDFGLAKLQTAPSTTAASVLSAMATANRPLTEAGTVLGTFQYMAPEQLEGKEADARTDLFALGAILYEMATGRRAFNGKSQASLIAAILSAEPTPLSSIQALAPPALERLVKVCLAKDPDDRLQTAHDVMQELKWIAEAGSAAGVPAPVAARRRSRQRLAWVLASAFGLAAFVVGFLSLRHRPEPPRVFQSSILPPGDARFDFDGSPMAVSPDGRRVAFTAGPPGGRIRLWIRSFEAAEAQQVPESEEAYSPFWSPDSRFLGFFAHGKLKKIDVLGGTPQALCDAPDGDGGTWSRDGVILFASAGPIHRVADSGGPSSPVTVVDEEHGDPGHAWPVFLPDGRHFLFFRYLGEQDRSEEGRRGLFLGSLDSKEVRLLQRVRANAAYAPARDGSSRGHLLYTRGSVLLARSLDERGFEFAGEAFPVADDVLVYGASSTAVLSVSETGLLAYQRGARGNLSELVWFDRSGKRLESLGEPARYYHPRLSHDGRRLAFCVSSPSNEVDLWVYDLPRRVETRFTFGPAVNIFPVWSPDDARIAFASNRNGMHGLYLKPATGSGNEELLVDSKTSSHWPTDWSADGRIAFQSRDTKTRMSLDVGVISLEDRKPTTFLATPFDEWTPQFSPDGRWLAYTSDESGRREVYVQAFPGPGGKWQVSRGGGAYPAWRRDGKEIFFVTLPEKQLLAAEVKSVSGFEVGAPRVLFQTQIRWSDIGRQYDVSPDGSRFLINTLLDAGPEPFIVVQNFLAGRARE